MIKFINHITGGEMMVADEMADLYKAAGHIPAAELEVSGDDPEATPEEKPTRRRGRPAKRRK